MNYLKKPIGLSFELGLGENHKPFIYIGKQKVRQIRPTDKNLVPALHGGIKIDFTYGTMRSPIPKFWKKEFWSREYMVKEPATNRWNSGNHWFVLTLPRCVGMFLFAAYGPKKVQPGFYFGFKTYEVDKISQNLIDYSAGNPEVQAHYKDECAWGTDAEKGNYYMVFSLAFRKDMVDNK